MTAGSAVIQIQTSTFAANTLLGNAVGETSSYSSNCLADVYLPACTRDFPQISGGYEELRATQVCFRHEYLEFREVGNLNPPL
jgi:hypothetical protein